jgi:putative oxidoreductase
MFLFRPSSPRQLSLGLAALRVTLGTVFIAHGYMKLFTFGFAGVSGMFGHMGVPLPGLTGPIIAVLEFFGGIGLLVGLLTRLFAIGLALDMIGAIFFVKLHGGFFIPAGFEFELMLLGSSVTLALAGAGRFSVDALLAGRDKRPIAPAPSPSR